jgi:hypothetical protein
MQIRNPQPAIRNPASRLLIIGLDGGTWSALGPLCEYGEMPNLARLRSQGAWADLLSTQPPFTAPAWSSIVTGVNPGKHGVLDFLHKPQDPARSLRNEGTPVNSSHIQAPTVWEYLNAEKRQVGVMNFPLSCPLRPVDDFAISGMLTPPNANDWTYPPALAEELDEYVVELNYGRPGKELRREDLPLPAQMLGDVSKMTERRGFNALKLMQSRSWDVFAVVFTGTDRIYHHFWHYLQPADEEGVLRATAILGEIAEVLHPIDGSFDLSGFEDPVDGVVAIITRHPMRENQIRGALAAYMPAESIDDALARLLTSGRAQVVQRYGVRFWSAAPAHYPDSEQSQRTQPKV